MSTIEKEKNDFIVYILENVSTLSVRTKRLINHTHSHYKLIVLVIFVIILDRRWTARLDHFLQIYIHANGYDPQYMDWKMCAHTYMRQRKNKIVQTSINLNLIRPIDSFSATEKYDIKSWCPIWDATLSRWWFTAHSLSQLWTYEKFVCLLWHIVQMHVRIFPTYNLERSGWPVPTYLLCKCSQFLENDMFTLKRSIWCAWQNRNE